MEFPLRRDDAIPGQLCLNILRVVAACFQHIQDHVLNILQLPSMSYNNISSASPLLVLSSVLILPDLSCGRRPRWLCWWARAGWRETRGRQSSAASRCSPACVRWSWWRGWSVVTGHHLQFRLGFSLISRRYFPTNTRPSWSSSECRITLSWHPTQPRASSGDHLLFLKATDGLLVDLSQVTYKSNCL